MGKKTGGKQIFDNFISIETKNINCAWRSGEKITLAPEI